jgi:signal transduction histidine kinase
MDREDALRLLESDSAHDRLRASRYLLRNPRAEDLSAVEKAFRRETVLWTRTTLQGLLQQLKGELPHGKRNEDRQTSEIGIAIERIDATLDDVAGDLYRNALNEVTSQILHEVEPLVGVLSVYASSEILNYADSKTKQQIERLNGLLDAIGEVRRASSPAAYGQFDLAEMINRCAESHFESTGVSVQIAGPDPFITLGDRSRVEVAFDNGLRNASDATLGVEPPELREPITVNWGATDDEYWIAILDYGTGLKGNTHRMFDFGTTTKKKHFGVGLPTARQAIASLGGVISLTPREPVGARFELRWPRIRRATT